MSSSLNYKKLKVWQKAHQNTLRAIELHQNVKSKKFNNIFKQFVNAAASIGANIAEGSADFRGREFTRFLKLRYVQLLR